MERNTTVLTEKEILDYNNEGLKVDIKFDSGAPDTEDRTLSVGCATEEGLCEILITHHCKDKDSYSGVCLTEEQLGEFIYQLIGVRNWMRDERMYKLLNE